MLSLFNGLMVSIGMLKSVMRISLTKMEIRNGNYGNCRKGRRPSFTDAAGPALGNELYEKFLSICAELGYPPQHGRFGADMQVESINDGPVTLILDTDQLMDTPRRK